MLDELYDMNELQPGFVEETEKPYDKYLKLHKYDPKTNTVEIDGERVNAGAKGSNKQRNRMNKILRENDYDPKSGTYKSDIKTKNPSTGKMENQRVKLNFDTRNPTWTDSMRNRGGGVDFEDSNINIQPKDLRKKPKDANWTLKHEEGHLRDNNDRDISHNNRSKEIRDIKDEIKEVNDKDFKDLKYSRTNRQMRHANDPNEKYADLYSELHNKRGFGGTKLSGDRSKSEYKDRSSEAQKRRRMERIDALTKERDMGPSRDEVSDKVVSDDEKYNSLTELKNDAHDKVSSAESIAELRPEDRLALVLGYPLKEAIELKMSGKAEEILKKHNLDDESIQAKLKEHQADYDKYDNDVEARRNELLGSKDIQNKISERMKQGDPERDARYNERINREYDALDHKKNFDAEMDSRSNYVESKIRELAEKDPEVKRKLAQYDEAIARRKQKLEKRKANKAEARAREQEARRAQEYTEYYLDDIEITW
jgi:hypothetical protein